MTLPTPPASLQDLLDRAAIIDLKTAYAYGVDTRDWALYRSIFMPRVAFDFYDFAGIREERDADEWVAEVKGNLQPFDATQHTFSNHHVTLMGDEATLVTNMTARHVFEGEAQIMGGFYTERMVRTPDGWRIAACKLTITWEEGSRELFARAAAVSGDGSAELFARAAARTARPDA